MKTKNLILNILSYILYAAQLVVSVIFLVYIFKLDMLPNKIVAVCVVAVCVLAIANLVFIIRKHLSNKIFSVILSCLLTVIMIVPIHVMMVVDNTLGTIQGETDVYHSNYEILVRSDDTATLLSDISEYIIGIDTAHDRESAEAVVRDIEKKLNTKVTVVEYSSAPDLWNALTQSKEVSAILIDHSFYEMYSEMYIELGESVNNYVKQIENITVSIQVSTTRPEATDNIDASGDVGATEIPATPTIEPTPASNKELCERPFVIYVSGIDISGPITLRSRSDVNILVVINPKTKNMLLVTVPRDTFVPLPGISNGMGDKLTHAGIYGDNCSVSIATLEQHIYTGIKIDKWIRANFTSVELLVDALGGITVESHYDFTAGGYTFVKGTNYLNGAQALAFSRERKSFAAGDAQRGKHQLEVIKGIFNKAISPAILTSYTEILNEISDCIQTSLTYEDITGLVKMQLSDGASWKIDMMSIENEYIYDYCYSLPGLYLGVGKMKEESRLQAIAAINSVLNG